MADPLSVCLGVITLLGAARKICHGLSGLQHAPREIEELRNAADDVTAVLDRVVLAIKTKRANGQQHFCTPLFQPTLDATTNVTKQLEACLKDIKNDETTSALRKGLDRITWLRRRALVKDYAVRLVNAKASLLCVLQAEQLYVFSSLC